MRFPDIFRSKPSSDERSNYRREYEVVYRKSSANGTPMLSCTAGVKLQMWETILSIRARLHDQVTAELTEKYQLDPWHRHIVLRDPQETEGGKTTFRIDFTDGPRPINLATLYPVKEK